MTRVFLVLICVLSACSKSPSARIAAVLDSLVPGTRIGALAAPAAHKQNLEFNPWFGYSGASSREATGFKEVVLEVNEHVSMTERPSDSARIARVSLAFSSQEAATSALIVLTRKLGPPERFCYRPADKPLKMALYFWPDERSVDLMLMVGSLEGSPAATLTFGAMPLELHPDFKSATRGGCDAA